MLTAGLRNTFPPSLIRVVITLDPSLKKKEAAMTDPTQIIIGSTPKLVDKGIL